MMNKIELFERKKFPNFQNHTGIHSWKFWKKMNVKSNIFSGETFFCIFLGKIFSSAMIVCILDHELCPQNVIFPKVFLEFDKLVQNFLMEIFWSKSKKNVFFLLKNFGLIDFWKKIQSAMIGHIFGIISVLKIQCCLKSVLNVKNWFEKCFLRQFLVQIGYEL